MKLDKTGLTKLPPNASVTEGSVEQLPFKDHSFDTVVQTLVKLYEGRHTFSDSMMVGTRRKEVISIIPSKELKDGWLSLKASPCILQQMMRHIVWLAVTR